MFEENQSKSVRITGWKDHSINEETMAPRKQLHIVSEAFPTWCSALWSSSLVSKGSQVLHVVYVSKYLTSKFLCLFCQMTVKIPLGDVIK